MKKSEISIFSRILLFTCSLGLLVVLFNPIWRIELQAPQYPEGLTMFIHANKLAGDVAIINGLNHYIGMKTLHTEDFPEFSILPGIILFFSLLILIGGFAGKRKLLQITLLLFLLFCIIAMIDFWRWEYEYGHNLNPNAAIIVPGMAYQPPLLGFKQLLNFGAYSVPALGGWIFIAVGILLLTSVLHEWKTRNKIKMPPANVALVILGFTSMLTFIGCSSESQPLVIGKDNCEFCKMTISDNRFGAELITTKNKIYKFDDVHCILQFTRSAKISENQIAAVYFTNFNLPHQLLHADQAHLLHSPAFKSPMNGNIAAFINEDSLANMLPKFSGQIVTWEGIQK